MTAMEESPAHGHTEPCAVARRILHDGAELIEIVPASQDQEPSTIALSPDAAFTTALRIIRVLDPQLSGGGLSRDTSHPS